MLWMSHFLSRLPVSNVVEQDILFDLVTKLNSQIAKVEADESFRETVSAAIQIESMCYTATDRQTTR